MHPNRAFAWTDETAIRGFIADIAFAHVFAATPDGPMVSHVPVIVTGEGNLRFHLSRGNRLTPHLAGLTALASVMASDFYVSPDWYESADQVPTWDYVAAEAEGPVRRLSDAELVAQIEALSKGHEERLAPKPVWSPAKLGPGILDRMLHGIVGFELEVTALRGTRKLSQNREPADIAGVVAALQALGRPGDALLVEEANAAKLRPQS
jgi:transcriptional regulator